MRSPHVKESGFPNKRIFFLVESGVLDFGIRNTAPEIRNPTNGRIQNPSFTYKENGIHCAEQSRQNPRLSWIPLQEMNDISKTFWPQWFFLACKEGVVCRGTQREILRKRPKNNNKAWIKLSEAILSILGDCWEKFFCSTPPARLTEEFPASRVHLQHSTWLTGKFSADVCPEPVWVWS